jgi:prephenate dehydrogenase
MDLGSTKTQIVSQMAELPDHIQPLGGHPMCGKEVSGIAAAEVELYRDRTFILTPLPRTSKAALALGCALVKAVGARPLILDPARHDRLVATASHLPYLLACALVGTADAAASADPTVWQVTASGFRDTSRLAASDVTMMLDVLLTNREAVLSALSTCEAQLRQLARLIDTGDEEELRSALTTIGNLRTGK